MKGRIKYKSHWNHYAFIEVEGANKNIYVKIKNCAFSHFVNGQEVKFDTEETGRRPGDIQAVKCKLISHEVPSQSANPPSIPSSGERRKGIVSFKWRKPIVTQLDNKDRETRYDLTGNWREGDIVTFSVAGRNAHDVRHIGNVTDEEKAFINPYNFVRVSQPRKSDRTPFEIDHTKFLKDAYTGKMRFRLTNISPLFIPDTETKTEYKAEDHWRYDFFKINGRLAIPGTSLKGMIRSVYETITNSCFSQINRVEEKINFRERPAGDILKPGIVLTLPAKGCPGKILRCEEAWVDRYFKGREYDIGNGQRIAVYNIDSGYENGQLVTFNAVPYAYQKRNNGFSFNHAKDVRTKGGACKGYLKMTGKAQNSRKHNERVFYHQCFTGIQGLSGKSKEIGKECELLETSAKGDIFEFDLPEKHKYDSILKTQLDTKKASLYKKGQRLDKGTVYYNRGLSAGDLIYFKEAPGNAAKRIANVSIPKSTFNENVYNLLEAYSKDLLPCTNVERLCPACQLFGAVDLEDKEKKVSIAGRVKVGNAIIRDDVQPKLTETTLKILGSPHETATNFYLIGEEYNNTTPILKQTGRGYDSTAPKPILRGRKFYWHQCDENKGLDPSAYQMEKRPLQSNQNATVELLEPGAAFEFDIHFENLTGDELARLLWSVELAPGLYHKLGHGKPLGLGSVKIEMDMDRKKTWLTDPASYYLDMDSDGRKPFEFENPLALWNIGDMKAILKPHEAMFSQIRYPAYVAIAGKNAGESIGFQWFMKFGNEQLFTISETTEGKRQSKFTRDIKEQP